VVAFAVGLSQLYLGVHWMTDVLAGWALAGMWGSLLLIGDLAARRPLAGDPSAAGPPGPREHQGREHQGREHQGREHQGRDSGGPGDHGERRDELVPGRDDGGD
jgi:hypothetical protein